VLDEISVPFEVPTLALLALATLLAEPARQARAKLSAPPGMVLIEGGRTSIGSTVREIVELGQRDETIFRVTAVETPQHQLDVESFFLMVNEVTNEQYLAFVRATGTRVPEHWAEMAIEEGQRAYLESLEARILAARQAGVAPPERLPFARSAWWREHADAHKQEGVDWTLPKGLERQPVVYVDYQSAQEYARWAGLRLMTEFEFQRAGRGDDARRYPWGDHFDPAKAVTLAMRIQQPKDVGSLPEGATAAGIHELSGNVWEWTSSPFVPYPKYKRFDIEIGKGKEARPIDGTIGWDENARVAVGGSFQTGEIAARLTTRRDSDRSQSTDSLGFRCAASTIAGLDRAQAVLEVDVPPRSRPENVRFDLSKVVATDRWTSSRGTSPLANYGVIEGYDHALFVPVVELEITSALQLDEVSHATGPVTLGILSITLDAIEPALPKGTYFVSYLAKGDHDFKSTANGIALDAGSAQDGGEVVELPVGLDLEHDNLVFYSPDDRAVAALPLSGMEFIRPKEPAVRLGPSARAAPQSDPSSAVKPADAPFDQIVLDVNTWVRVANKGFNYDIVLRFEKGSLGEGWRR
jgi:formylglycine-generating enzyme required for sulfatase activity